MADLSQDIDVNTYTLICIYY